MLSVIFTIVLLLLVFCAAMAGTMGLYDKPLTKARLKQLDKKEIPYRAPGMVEDDIDLSILAESTTPMTAHEIRELEAKTMPGVWLRTIEPYIKDAITRGEEAAYIDNVCEKIGNNLVSYGQDELNLRCWYYPNTKRKVVQWDVEND